jgi:hypothetical protein
MGTRRQWDKGKGRREGEGDGKIARGDKGRWGQGELGTRRQGDKGKGRREGEGDGKMEREGRRGEMGI